jgi:PAS domain S-box-containing protein
MEEKSVMSKLKKLSSKRQTQNIVKVMPVNVDQGSVHPQKIFDAIPVGIISIDSRGKIQYMNRAAKLLLGEPDQTLSLAEWPQKFGLYLKDTGLPYPQEKLPLVRALYGETVEAEEMIVQKDNNQQGGWISMSTEPVRDEYGNIEGAIACIWDISHRKQMDLSQKKQVQQIEAIQRFLHTLAEAGNDLNKIMNSAVEFTTEVIGDLSSIALLNVDGDKLKIGAFHDTLPAGQALLSKLLPNFEYDYPRTLARSVIQSGEPLLLPTTTAEQLQDSMLPIFDEFIREFAIKSVLIVPLMGQAGVLGTLSLYRHQAGKPFNVEDQSLLTDIAYHTARAIEKYHLFESLIKEVTERLSAKQALEASEARFLSIFESVTVGITVLELNGDILQTNSAFQEMLGYTEDELLGRKFHDFLYPADVGQAIKLFQDVNLKGLSNFRFEHRAVHQNGSILWVKTIFTVIKYGVGDDAPGFVAGIVENITEQRRLESEMAELNSRLQSSMELERLRLAQELHDGPMQSLHSAIYRIEEIRSKTNSQLEEELNDLRSTIHSMLQDLRATAKELCPPTIFNFGLENAIRSHANDIVEKNPHMNIHLSLAHDRQILPEKVRLALFRIFQQSVSNVIRHSEATDLRVRFSFDAEETHLEISDNGKGFDVPPNWMEFVRQEHYGLAGAAERASALGGVMSVESKPGNSTIVRVTIPWKETTE